MNVLLQIIILSQMLIVRQFMCVITFMPHKLLRRSYIAKYLLEARRSRILPSISVHFFSFTSQTVEGLCGYVIRWCKLCGEDGQKWNEMNFVVNYWLMNVRTGRTIHRRSEIILVKIISYIDKIFKSSGVTSVVPSLRRWSYMYCAVSVAIKFKYG